MVRVFFVLLFFLGLSAIGYGGLRLVSDTPDRRSVSDKSSASEADVAESAEPFMRGFAETEDEEPSFSPSMRIGGDVLTPQTANSDFVNTLREVPIAHETPETARFGRAFEVTVAVDGTGGDSAADALPGDGNVVESFAMISADVRATLSGDAFEIEPLTPMVQTISPITENVWRWNAIPLETGRQNLTIEVFALDGQRALPVRTFRDRVEVRVSTIGQAIALADALSPVAVVIGGFGSLIAGLIGILRFFRGR